MSDNRIEADLLRTTIKIESIPRFPGQNAIGSGFFVTSPPFVENIDQRWWFLVTNKHIVGDWSLADGDIQEFYRVLRLFCYGSDSQLIVPIEIELTDSAGKLLPDRVLLHPDPSVDVALVFIPVIKVPFDRLSIMSFDPSYLLKFAQIENHLMGLGDQVFALGYPMGITSLTTSHPIAKSGYLSTVPGQTFGMDITGKRRNGVPIKRRLEGKVCLVDGLIVPGNSGGPVILPSDLRVRRDPVNNQLQVATQNLKNLVIGIVSMSLANSGLSLVFASDYIIEIIDAFTARFKSLLS